MKYVALKVEDVDAYLSEKEKIELSNIYTKVATSRMIEGKDINSYLVVNMDEPYADNVKTLIEESEGELFTF